MWNSKFVFLALALGTLPFSTIAGVKVAGLDFSVDGNKGRIGIITEGRSNELPDVKVAGKTIAITFNKADPFGPINKRAQGAELSAISLNGVAVVKIDLPYDVPSEGVNLGWKSNKIEVVFTRGTVKKIAALEKGISSKEALSPKAEASVLASKKITKESLNEDYLNGLMKENRPAAKAVINEQKDEVKVKQAAADGAGATSVSNSASFAGYAAKFTVFLAMVLGLFYGIVQLMKKGVFSRGKLGFLNNTQMIEVLSTTYVAPKRSLMVVRAHKQIFLVANSETGLTFLSEMADTSGLIKAGEKFVSGSNFDLKLSEAESTGALEAYRVKENIMESSPPLEDKGLAKLASAKDDIVKFSEELKKKAKKLRPIENRAN